ncbi:YbdK family carboxylate-amine ligase [Ideonella oryzae]|uniref:Putative glutamate--cysteine ligase 2 n=1 Tax=Ideonella oryzae TaxID=2937441 RepID=A0ABT1BLA7_9BURK|nr:YbdK family carboxylate-amine ligase [Ideonella oryzae]MCO5977015.1 YbdK family carboxylate-amine ligase [Ideonella oryzae]
MRFAASETLSLGLELELQLVSATTGQLSPSGSALWEALQASPTGRHFALEATQATIELNASVHQAAESLRQEVHALVTQAQAAAGTLGLALRGGGTHVAQFWNERVLSPTNRAQVLDQRFGFLPKRFSTYGMHVHVGMPDAESAVRVANVLQAHTPLLIALSAASPFLQHGDSGFAACRPLEPLIYPHGGPLPPLRDWAHFCALVRELCDTGIAESLKDIYWDVRPKPEFGTVEVRVFDTPLNVDRAVDLAAWTRALAGLALNGQLALPQPRCHVTEAKVSRFLACRDGLQARLFDPVLGDWVNARAWALALSDQMARQLPTPMDRQALDRLAAAWRAGEGTQEDHARMRALWRHLSPDGALPDGTAPAADTLAAYSAALCAQLAPA